MLVACVMEIYRSERIDGAESALPEAQDLGEMITLYSLSLIIESAVRTHGLSAPRPSLDTFFSWDRIRRLAKTIPELSDFLDRACILKHSKQGWLGAIKDKILSGWRGNGLQESNN
jgi:hypothetical protein